MKQQIIYCLLFFMTFSISLFAQSDKQAEQIVADFIKSVEKNTVFAEFEILMLDENDVQIPFEGERSIETIDGIFRMKGHKFALLLPETHLFFNGELFWHYSPDFGLTSVIESSDEFNPSTILMLQERLNNNMIKFSESNNSVEYYFIELIPTANVNDPKILVQINKTTKKLSSIRLGEAGEWLLINFKNFQKNIDIPDSYFVFDTE